MRTEGALRTAPTRVSKKTPYGEIRFSSMSTSTPRPERVLAPPIKRDGLRLPGRWWRTGALARRPRPRLEAARDERGIDLLRRTFQPVRRVSRVGCLFAPAISI